MSASLVSELHSYRLSLLPFVVSRMLLAGVALRTTDDGADACGLHYG